MRPQTSHRLSVGSTSSPNTNIRQPSSRHHSQSLSLGSVSGTPRVTRRKSMNASAAHSAAAIAAALQEDGHAAPKYRSLNSRNIGVARNIEPSKNASPMGDRIPLSEPSGKDMTATYDEDSAIADDFLSIENLSGVPKPKIRRASEGSHLSKGEGKRSSGELRCEKCGKGYKHSSCLTKHLSVSSDPSVFQLLALHLQHFLLMYPIHCHLLDLLLTNYKCRELT